MNGFKKFIKNFIWLCEVLILLAVSAGVIYGIYDYYTGGAEKYDKLFTQAKFWVMNMKNKITGEETVELVLEEVSPSKLPEMTLSLEGTSRDDVDGNHNNVVYDEEDRRVIFVYGKDIGGDLYFPYKLSYDERIEAAWLFTGNEEDMLDVTEYVTHDAVSGAGIVSQDFLMGLEPGEYYIFLDPVNEQGDGVGAHCVPLIIEEQTTYISTQRGFAGTSPFSDFLFNDLQSVHRITLPFYNLGDDRIVMLKEVIDGLPGQSTEHSLSSSDYEINSVGNAVTLTEEYLSGFSVNEMRRFKVVLSSGNSLDIGYHRLFTIDGDPDWLSASGADVYDQSEGGDFVLDIHKGWAQKYHCVSIWGDDLIVEELTDNNGGDNPLLDEEHDQIVIPESIMKSLDSDYGYNLVLAYVYPGTGFINYNYGFYVVP